MDRLRIQRAAALFVLGGFAALAVLAAGCGKARRVETKVRDDGAVTHTLTNNEVKVEGAVKYHAEFVEGNYSVEQRIILDVQSVEGPQEAESYALLLTFMGASALNIEPGRSLEIVADLNSYVLSAEGGVKRTRDPSGQYYSEYLRYPVTQEILSSMAGSGTVQVIVKGRDGDAMGYFDPTNFADFRRFVAEHAGGSRAP